MRGRPASGDGRYDGAVAAVQQPGTEQGRPVVALIASMVLGAGYGLCVAYGLTEVAALAPAHRLARLTSSFWTPAYLGFLAPYVITLCTGLFAPPTILIGAAVLAVSTLVLITYRGTGQAHGN
ncbi:hypothetical protein [Streptomyces tubercidicus]